MSLESSAPADAVVWVGGGLVDAGTATVGWADHGLTVGDGVFETIELRAGRPFALTRHLDRLEGSAAGLGIEAPTRDELREAAGAVAAAWGPRPGRLRVTLTSGPGPMGSGRGDGPPTLVVAAVPMTVLVDPAPVVVVDWTRNERGALAGIKSTSYAENVMALAVAERHGATEALFANTRDELCEGTGSNVFVGIGGDLVTPPLSSGCLAGITRALLLEALDAAGHPAVERPVPMTELGEVEEAFLVSTGRHVQPISAIGAQELPGCPGPLTRRARQAWVDAVRDVDDP